MILTDADVKNDLYKVNLSNACDIAKILTDDDEKELDVICTLQLNRSNGNENVELIIEDILSFDLG